MTPRLMHKKSRAGCTRCKSRKVKCDERRPVCGACRKHGVDCGYSTERSLPPRAQNHRHHSHTPTSTDEPGQSVASNSPPAVAVDALIPGAVHDELGISLPESRDRRLLELRMMQIYMRSFRSMSAGIHRVDLVDVWENAIPALAMETPFLLHGLFALTALHFIVSNGGRRPNGAAKATRTGLRAHSSGKDRLVPRLPLERMEEVRVMYFNMAIEGHRKAVANLHAGNADCVCISTVLLSHSGFLVSQDFNPGATAYAPPVHWLWLASGVHSVMAEARPMLAPDSATVRIIRSAAVDFEADRRDMDNGSAFFSPLLDFDPEADSADADMAVYRRVLYLMGLVRVSLLREEPATTRLRRTISFASTIPTRFITFVDEHRPRALTILACFFAMTKENGDIWWLRGAAETHVLGLKTLIPDSWQRMLHWPLTILNAHSAGQRVLLYQQETVTA